MPLSVSVLWWAVAIDVYTAPSALALHAALPAARVERDVLGADAAVQDRAARVDRGGRVAVVVLVRRGDAAVRQRLVVGRGYRRLHRAQRPCPTRRSSGRSC